MIILHAGQCNGTFVLWGEARREDGATSPAARPQRTRPTGAIPYPFGASGGELSEALKRTGLHLKPSSSGSC